MPETDVQKIRVIGHVCRLNFGWIARWEVVILWASAGFSQISDVLRAGQRRESLSLLGGIVKKGVFNFPIPPRGRFRAKVCRGTLA